MKMTKNGQVSRAGPNPTMEVNWTGLYYRLKKVSSFEISRYCDFPFMTFINNIFEKRRKNLEKIQIFSLFLEKKISYQNLASSVFI